MKKIFGYPKSLKPASFHYCPGCGHSIIHRLLAELIDELNIRDNCICVPPVGCAVLAYNYFDIDMGEAPHGRALAVATGIKRALPEKIVFTYQGDGDIAAIGTSETIHAANRGENITAIFVNNSVYGMTGGQMAPTTLIGMNSTTTQNGRVAKRDGYTLDLTKMLSCTEGSTYIERVSVTSPSNIKKTYKALKKAFSIQFNNLGFSLIEILSPCPTNWKLTPIESLRWIDNTVSHVFPLGVIKDKTNNNNI